MKYGTFLVSAVVLIEWLSFSDCQPSVVLNTTSTLPSSSRSTMWGRPWATLFTTSTGSPFDCRCAAVPLVAMIVKPSSTIFSTAGTIFSLSASFTDTNAVPLCGRTIPAPSRALAKAMSNSPAIPMLDADNEVARIESGLTAISIAGFAASLPKLLGDEPLAGRKIEQVVGPRHLRRRHGNLDDLLGHDAGGDRKSGERAKHLETHGHASFVMLLTNLSNR